MTRSLWHQSRILGCMSSIAESLDTVVEVDEIAPANASISSKSTFGVKFPASKVMWSPQASSFGDSSKLMALASDRLKLFEYSDGQGLQFKTELHNTMLKDLGGPLTSFDWSARNNLICCSSIDTTCSLYDVNQGRFYKQLIAHDKEVE